MNPVQAPSTLAASLASAPAARPQTERPQPAAREQPQGFGLPHDRHARIAARRTFVELKQRFMAAVDDIGGNRARWLQLQVRQAEEPVDLWLLRGLVQEALEQEGPATERTRRELQAALAAVFPSGGELLPYGVRR